MRCCLVSQTSQKALLKSTKVLIAKALVNTQATNIIPLCFINPGNKAVTIKEGAIAGLLQPAEALSSSIVPTMDKQNSPTTVQEVRRFIGLASYCRRFVKDFASIAKPLHNLDKKNAHFQWHAENQAAFDTLKHHLTTVPVLGYPLDHGGMILDTDNSDTGIGAVLSQMQGGTERVSAYGSRTYYEL
ncbi:hypothetical protein F2P79_022982 [Pimephales promelas]|nr:hypothetical protein F2P79_022982 [Pimephales promelas]